MVTLVVLVLGLVASAGAAAAYNNIPAAVLVVYFGIFGLALHLASAADEYLRRRKEWPMIIGGLIALALFLLLLGCAHAPAKTAATSPEPATIHRLDCGGSTCSITTAGPSTVIWVTD